MYKIKEFENYFIDEQGNVYHKQCYKNGKIKINLLKQKDNMNGYKYVSLFKNNKEYKRYVHRLVAQTFINNPNSLPEVNHIDGNKQNNNIDNLEWCSRKYNHQHAIDTGLFKTKPILKYDKEGNLIKRYSNFKELKLEMLNVTHSGISNACHTLKRTYKDYFWRYESSVLPVIPFKKKKTNIIVNQYDLEGKFIKQWNSYIEATKSLNLPIGDISRVCSGKRKTSGGYIWKKAN